MKSNPHARYMFFTMLVAMAVLAPRGTAQVQDNAHIFSQQAIDQADQTINQIESKHRHQLLVVTYPSIPQAQQADFERVGKEQFFKTWVEQVASDQHVSGVVVLINMDPKHFEVAVGNETQKRLFMLEDRTALQQHLTPYLRDQKYDDALTKTAKFVLDKMNQNDPGNTGASSVVDSGNGHTSNGQTSNSQTSNGQTGDGQTGYPYPHTSYNRSSGGGWMGWAVCAGVGIIILIVLLRLVFGRGTGGYSGYGGGGYGGNYGGAGNYPPQQGGGYGPGYGAPQQRGGFGSGFLGGLLGGAVGGYAADRLMNRNEGNIPQQGGAPMPPQQDSGGGFTPDTSFSSGGSDFGSSDSSSSGGSSGADFGGGDSGGSSGGDFGGGGGGDSGSSGGGDF